MNERVRLARDIWGTRAADRDGNLSKMSRKWPCKGKFRSTETTEDLDGPQKSKVKSSQKYSKFHFKQVKRVWDTVLHCALIKFTSFGKNMSKISTYHRLLLNMQSEIPSDTMSYRYVQKAQFMYFSLSQVVPLADHLTLNEKDINPPLHLMHSSQRQP